MKFNNDEKRSSYVNNKDFFIEMCAYVKLRNKEDIQARKQKIATNTGRHPQPTPPTKTIAKKIYDIVYNYSYNYNFINYTYKDMMVTEALWSCIRYCDRFNPKISENPFAYFTQIAYHAFVKVINGEKKISDIKKKLLDIHFCENVAKTNTQDLDNIIISVVNEDFQPLKIIKDGVTTTINTEDEWLCHTFNNIIKKYDNDVPKRIVVDNEILLKMITKHQEAIDLDLAPANT